MEEKDGPEVEYFVQRKVLDELRLDELAQKGTWATKPTLGERVKESVRCSGSRLKRLLLSCFPVLGWLPHYSLREDAVGDLISGCSVGVMHLPQGMAYALLAGLPAVYGLYTSFYPVLVYFIFGTSRHISIGTFAVISVMIGTATQRLAPGFEDSRNDTNTTGIEDNDALDARRVEIACALTVLTGIFQVLLGLVKFGFVVNYLSEPLVRAYTTGSACHVCISQLKYLFGVKPGSFSGPLGLIYTLVDIFRQLPKTQVPEVVVSITALAVLIVVKELNGCYREKLPMSIPIEIIVVILGTVISYYCALPSKYSIDVVGEIPSGLRAPQVPNSSLFPSVVGEAFAVAIVGFAINISLGKTFALKYGYKVDSNQEFVALGLSNTIGSFFQCYAVTSSMSRSLVQESTGCKTQVTGLVSSVIVLIAILKIGSLFQTLPKAILSAIILVNLKGMFKQFMDVPMLWRTNKVDMLVWVVTLISTILLNLDIGLGVAVGFAMLVVIFRTQLPHFSILGHVSGTDLYLDTEAYKEAKEIPGIKIFHSSVTIYYTNAEMYVEALQEKTGIDVGRLLSAKKKKEAKLKRKQEKEKKRAKKEAKRQQNVTKAMRESEVNEAKISPGLNGHGPFSLTDPSTSLGKGQINWAFQHDKNAAETDSDTCCHGDDSITQVSQHVDEEKGQSCRPDTHSIILDLSTTSFVDTVTVKTLKNMFRDFGVIDLDIYLAGCQVCVVKQLEEAEFFSESIPKSRLFVTVHDAVLHILHKVGQTDRVLDVSCTTQM